MIRLLHPGCGGDPLPPWLGQVKETRLDIDPAVSPHIVASMTELGDIGEFDVIWCCHALEHLSLDEVRTALGEFHRVLRPGGKAMILVPDLEGVLPTHEPLYESPAGPISGHDMYYGHAGSIGASDYMRHRCGFISKTLLDAMNSAGFSGCETMRVPAYNLLGVGTK